MADVPYNSTEVPVIEWDFRFSPRQSIVFFGSSGHLMDGGREGGDIGVNLIKEKMCIIHLFLFFYVS